MTVAEFELAFTRCRKNLKTVGNLTVRNSLQDSDNIERYLHPKYRSVLFQNRRKMFYFHHLQMFTRCRFHNVPVRLPFSKSTVFKMCRQKCFRLNGRPILHIFYRFQKVPASCERSQSEPSHKNIEVNQSVLVVNFGCLFPQIQSAGSYFAVFLFAGFYCSECTIVPSKLSIQNAKRIA